MSLTVSLSADAMGYPEGSGHLWAYLNWALGLRASGCRVIWLEPVSPRAPAERTRRNAALLMERLATLGEGWTLALYRSDDGSFPQELAGEAVSAEDAAAASDALISLRYATPEVVVRRFRRSALVDIDPGQLQMWMSRALIRVARHDVYFTLGEGIGEPGARFATSGIPWRHSPVCVALDDWPAAPTPAGAPFTTITHWNANEWFEDGGTVVPNDKRSGFLPFLGLPRMTRQPLELALCLSGDEESERQDLLRKGWLLRDAWSISSSLESYRGYIQGSAGEFSCAKPAYVRLGNAFFSDRTACYLASGKPAVVQYTGPSRFIPEGEGIFRFKTPAEAVAALDRIAADYARQSKLARALAEEYLDARKVAGGVLNQVLP